MELQTIDGELLLHEQFKEYLLSVLQVAADNQSFNYAQFLYDLRHKCDMTLEELMGFIHEISIEQIESAGLLNKN